MARAATLALLVLACACAQQQQQPASRAERVSEPASPVLLRYLPPQRGGPSAFPEAQVQGVLDLGGACVRLQDPHGRTTTVVSSSGPYLGQDIGGLYIQSGEERLRHGASVTGGGGWFDDFPAALGALDGPIPEECRSGPFVVVTGIERFDPADRPPLRSPPPPPDD
jgi:hypothetical protein